MSKKKKNSKAFKRDFIDSERAEYEYHLPVLLNESLDYLISDTNGIYIDGTLGGGGHSFEILNKLSYNGRLYSFDMDEDAINHCKKRFATELASDQPRITLVNQNFLKACSIEEIKGKTNGLLLDLGLSSMQLDESRHGFSYRMNSRLDMRFGSSGTNAEDLLHAAKEEEIERILRCYGEEPFATVIARRIGERRRAFRISSTYDLIEIVASCVPEHLLHKCLARTFQAIRIAVNDELNILENTLENSFNILANNGRIVVISYHSLEDRIVKNFFKKHSTSIDLNSYSQDANPNCRNIKTNHQFYSYSNQNLNSDKKYIEIDNNIQAIHVPTLITLTKKPVCADSSELKKNPRSRSAKLRAAQIVKL